jgi:hypothetical protein
MAKRKKKITQSQRQSVVVNIGTKQKSSGRGRLPPPSYKQNLAPTFITTPQIDYTPLFASLLKVQEIRNPVTPLSSTTQSARASAGEAAQRRAGPTADNFQRTTSASRMDEAPSQTPLPTATASPTPVVGERVPDAYYHDQIVPFKREPPRQGEAGQGASGGGLPGEGQRVGSQRGRPAGKKDVSPRKRRTKSQLADAKAAAEAKRAEELD